jgi:hypothetical protein
MSTTCPGTKTPPRTLSSSEILVEILFVSACFISESLIGFEFEDFEPCLDLDD